MYEYIILPVDSASHDNMVRGKHSDVKTLDNGRRTLLRNSANNASLKLIKE